MSTPLEVPPPVVAPASGGDQTTIQQPTDNNAAASAAAIAEVQADRKGGNVSRPIDTSVANTILPAAENVIDMGIPADEINAPTTANDAAIAAAIDVATIRDAIDVTPAAHTPLKEEDAIRLATKLREALDRRDIFGRPNPDAERIVSIMNSLGPHGDQIRAAYKTLPGRRSLTDDLLSFEQRPPRQPTMQPRVGLPLDRSR